MSEATFATVQRAFAEAMARPPIAADEARVARADRERRGMSEAAQRAEREALQACVDHAKGLADEAIKRLDE